ncbi:hypothetical protein I6A60_25530 [Frankia sp. AgB1.9]|uniref:hypothetical protein n=1 Tax=unclassified Frankia TaxID=2632575 RepID=UPI0019326B93|nr:MULTISPECIES: hypothetical protein [unclassified Frankia]MBL7489186.1 hypothetical protein [Frankia sp. AgW1.1]MBL7551201.1 hypothetical protein [Frankia sp. AgB1.9]MBL7618234.1 hypothetical protein [Frankia sp. AgB1.8]
MLIDCDTCSARGDACSDCVLSVLLAPPPVVEWDEDERRALALLADAGLLPRLRLVTPLDVVLTDAMAAEQVGPPEPVTPSQQAIPLGEPFAPGPRQRTRPAHRPDAAGPGRRDRRAG